MPAITQTRFGLSGQPYGSFEEKGGPPLVGLSPFTTWLLTDAPLLAAAEVGGDAPSAAWVADSIQLGVKISGDPPGVSWQTGATDLVVTIGGDPPASNWVADVATLNVDILPSGDAAAIAWVAVDAQIMPITSLSGDIPAADWVVGSASLGSELDISGDSPSPQWQVDADQVLSAAEISGEEAGIAWVATAALLSGQNNLVGLPPGPQWVASDATLDTSVTVVSGQAVVTWLALNGWLVATAEISGEAAVSRWSEFSASLLAAADVSGAAPAAEWATSDGELVAEAQIDGLVASLQWLTPAALLNSEATISGDVVSPAWQSGPASLYVTVHVSGDAAGPAWFADDASLLAESDLAGIPPGPRWVAPAGWVGLGPLQFSYGRQGIGVAQPQSGIDYPLVLPSDDVRDLLADFNLSYDHPVDEDEFRPPFRVQWLFGLGSLAPTDPIGPDEPVPQHGHDIIVIDRDDRVVFDSTQAGTVYASRDWTPRLRIVTWQQASTGLAASLVYHTAWGPNDVPRQYPIYFYPEDAVLDPRAVTRTPNRLRSLTAVLDSLRGHSELLAGYNIRIDVEHQTAAPGRRDVTRLTFHATPGSGLGIFPDCTPLPLTINRINGVGPTDEGSFFFIANDCYWVRQPTRVIGTNPRRTQPETSLVPGNIPTPGLPSPDAGTSKMVPGWPPNDHPGYAHLQFGNDCEPCCDCDDYVDAAVYLNRTRNKYAALGTQISASRNLYHDNRQRWLNSANCRLDRSLRVKLLAQFCPYLDVALQFCNQSEQCQTNIELSVALETSPAGGFGVEVPGFTFITGSNRVMGQTTPATSRYQMGGTWPTYTAFFDAVHPGQSAYVRFRLKFDDCGVSGGLTSPLAVTGCLTATSNGEPIRVVTPEGVVSENPMSSCDTQTLNCPMAPEATYNPFSCACDNP